MLKIIALVLTFWLTGCQSLSLTPKESSELRVPVGSSITLNEPLAFEIGYSRSFIQFGKPIRANELRKYYPYCQFYRYEHPDELQSERTMKPDTFRVTRSYRAMDFLSSGSGGILFDPTNRSGGPPDDNILGNIMKLKSIQQPEIVELKCAVLTEPSLSNYLTVAEIKEVLGTLVTISMK